MMGGKIDSSMQFELTECPEKEDTWVGTRFEEIEGKNIILFQN